MFFIHPLSISRAIATCQRDIGMLDRTVFDAASLLPHELTQSTHLLHHAFDMHVVLTHQGEADVVVCTHPILPRRI